MLLKSKRNFASYLENAFSACGRGRHFIFFLHFKGEVFLESQLRIAGLASGCLLPSGVLVVVVVCGLCICWLVGCFFSTWYLLWGFIWYLLNAKSEELGLCPCPESTLGEWSNC